MSNDVDFPTVDAERTRLTVELTNWWMDQAAQEVERTLPKVTEYGSSDLRDIGRDLAECMGRKVTDEEATEIGIMFYIRGKIGRWLEATKRGDRPSLDTLFDIGVYARMAQRNRAVGGFPQKYDAQDTDAFSGFFARKADTPVD